MGISAWQIILVIVLLILLFGRGRISSLMSEVAKGIHSFRAGLKEGQDSLNDADSDVIDVSEKDKKSDD